MMTLFLRHLFWSAILFIPQTPGHAVSVNESTIPPDTGNVNESTIPLDTGNENESTTTLDVGNVNNSTGQLKPGYCEILRNVCSLHPPTSFYSLCKDWCINCLKVPDVEYGEFELTSYHEKPKRNRTEAESCPGRRLYKYERPPNLTAIPPECHLHVVEKKVQFRCPPTTEEKAAFLKYIFGRFGPSDRDRKKRSTRDNVRPERQAENCTYDEPVDFAILLDASGSVGNETFGHTVDDVASLVEHTCNSFACGTPEIRYAVVTFDNTPTIEFDFQHSAQNQRSRKDVFDNIKRTKYKGGNTGTRPALVLARDAIFNVSNGMRETSRKKILILTDGKYNVGGNPKDVAESLYVDRSIEVFAIGIGRKLTYERVRELVHIEQFNRILPFLSYYSYSEFSQGIQLVIADAKLSKDACSSTSVKK